MARGFESKDVEFQQSEAERSKSLKRVLSAEERDAQARRLTLKLALSRTQSDLGLAKSAAHRQMLEQAVAAIREQIRQLSSNP
jgi:hypothetical protein